MEEEGFLVHEEGFITIGFIPPIPNLQTHHHVGMVSVPSMSQEEYEKAMLDLGPIAHYPDDDCIDIVCPGEVNGDVVRKFTMKRSSLQRSETLYQFFESKNYRFGCGMTLHFTQVPGACFSVVKDYLDRGPDRYTTADIVSNVSSHYTDSGKRCEIYTRLHKCARQLELVGLKMMVWAAIKDEDVSITAEHCVTLASFIFADQAGFGNQLKGWLMGHIKKHFDILNADPAVVAVGADPHRSWYDLVSTLSPGFRKEWKNLVTDRKSRLSMVEDEQDEQEQLFARVLKSLDTADLERAERAIRMVKDEKGGMAPKEVVTEMVEVNGDKEESDEWEDLDHLCPGPETSTLRTADDSKAREVLGVAVNPRFSTSTERSPRQTSIDLETAKARLVMGINSPSKGTIAGRRKQPALTRAAKSLTNLIRSPSIS